MMRRRNRTREMVLWIGSFLGVALAGCDAGPPLEITLPQDGVVSFAQHVQPIFNARCTSCHRAGSPTSSVFVPLILTAGDSYDALVNRPSDQRADLTLVVPGDSSASLLYQKIASSSPPVGSRMPLFRSALSDEHIGLVRDWIDQGALNN